MGFSRPFPQHGCFFSSSFSRGIIFVIPAAGGRALEQKEAGNGVSPSSGPEGTAPFENRSSWEWLFRRRCPQGTTRGSVRAQPRDGGTEPYGDAQCTRRTAVSLRPVSGDGVCPCARPRAVVCSVFNRRLSSSSPGEAPPSVTSPFQPVSEQKANKTGLVVRPFVKPSLTAVS